MVQIELHGHAQDCWVLSTPALSSCGRRQWGNSDQHSIAVSLMLAAAAAQLFLTVSLWRNGVECLEHDSAASQHYRQQTVEARVPEPSATHLHCYLSQRRPSISHIVAWCNSQSTACISYSKSIQEQLCSCFLTFFFFFLKENSMDNRKNKTHVRDDDSYQANPQSTIPHPHRNRKTKSSCSKFHAYTTWGLSTSKDHPTHECKSKHAVCSHTRNGDEIPQTPGPPLHPKMEGNGTQ